MNIYHTTLSYAAVSQVEHHTCVVMDEQGKYLARECYEHSVIPAQSMEEAEWSVSILK